MVNAIVQSLYFSKTIVTTFSSSLVKGQLFSNDLFVELLRLAICASADTLQSDVENVLLSIIPKEEPTLKDNSEMTDRKVIPARGKILLSVFKYYNFEVKVIYYITYFLLKMKHFQKIAQHIIIWYISAELLAEAKQYFKRFLAAKPLNLKCIMEIELRMLKKNKFDSFVEFGQGTFLEFLLESDIPKVLKENNYI